jgi:hypothetical protein
MSHDEYVSRRVTLPKFSGAHTDFQVWWTRFLAFTSVYQFMQAIRDDAEDAVTAEAEEKAETRRLATTVAR